MKHTSNVIISTYEFECPSLLQYKFSNWSFIKDVRKALRFLRVFSKQCFEERKAAIERGDYTPDDILNHIVKMKCKLIKFKQYLFSLNLLHKIFFFALSFQIKDHFVFLYPPTLEGVYACCLVCAFFCSLRCSVTFNIYKAVRITNFDNLLVKSVELLFIKLKKII